MARLLLVLVLLSCSSWTGRLQVGGQHNGRVHIERGRLLSCSSWTGLLLVGCQQNGGVHVERGLLLLLLLLRLLLLLPDQGSARRRLTRLDDLHDLRMRQPPSPAITVSAHSVSTCAPYTAEGISSSAAGTGAHSGESCTGFQVYIGSCLRSSSGRTQSWCWLRIECHGRVATRVRVSVTFRVSGLTGGWPAAAAAC